MLTMWSDYGWSLGEDANLAEKLKIEFLEFEEAVFGAMFLPIW